MNDYGTFIDNQGFNWYENGQVYPNWIWRSYSFVLFYENYNILIKNNYIYLWLK